MCFKEVTDMSRSKYVGFALVLCSLLAVPVLGKWVYQGTDVWTSDPDSDWDPYGTWWYEWNANGSVDANAFEITASGWAWARCGVALAWLNGDPLYQDIYVLSRVRGQSSYDWDPNTGGSKAISFDMETTLDTSGITYEGLSMDHSRISVVESYSGAMAYGGGGVSTVEYFYDQGLGSGYGITGSGAYAENDPDASLTVSVNDTAYGTGLPEPYQYRQEYEGALTFTASTENDDSGTPTGDTFLMDAMVGGEAFALGEITVNDPYENLYMGAQAYYWAEGETKIRVSGDIIE